MSSTFSLSLEKGRVGEGIAGHGRRCRPDVGGPLPNPPPHAGEGACGGELDVLREASWNAGVAEW